MLGTSKSVWGFDPRSVPGCALWLDGRDTSSMTFSGSTITQWNDKSGNGYNATISSGRIGATYSSVSNCVYFQASNVGYQTSYPANPTNETMFVVANIDSPSSINNNTLICGQQGARSLGIGWNGYAANACAYLNSHVQWQTSTPSGSYTAGTTALITGQVSGGTNLSIAMNGATFTTGSGGGFYAGTTTHLGVDTTTTQYYYQGFVMEILFYNSVLNTTQRQQVEGYLAHKWGLVAPSPTTPLTIPGCQLWLDAADSSTVSGTTTVTQWRDKSGNARHLGVGSGTTSYSSNAIKLNSSYMFVTSPVDLSKLSVFLVSKSNNLWNQPVFVIRPNTSLSYNSTDGLQIAFYDQIINIFSQDLTQYTDSGLINTTLITAQASDRTLTTWLNGTNQKSVTNSSARTSTAQGFAIGAEWGNGSYHNAISIASINELIVFNEILTTTQRQTIETYLAKKWSIGSASTIPLTHPFYSIRPHLRTFQPIDVPGCQLWLDAADSNTITLSSGSLTQWNDKSGNGRNLTAVSGYANATVSSAFQNGLNVFNFSGNGLYRAAANSAVYPLDAYIIVALKSLTAHSDVLSIGPTNADNFNSLIFSEGTQSRWKNGSSYGVRNLFSTTDETSTGFLLIQWSIANNNYLLRRNGILLAQSSSFTYSLPGGSIFQVGFRHTDITAANFSGYIGEIVVFNSQLGDSQRQQVEGYLAHKWGLTPSLPVISPLSIPGCQLWLDAADSSTLVLSGSSVTTWRDKSGLNNNATPYSTSPQRSGNSILFSGANALKCGAFLTSTTFSVFIVNNFTSGYDRISFGCWKVPFGSSVIFQDGSIRVGVNNSATYNVDATTSTPSYTNTRIYGLTLSSSSTPGSSFTFNGSIDGSNVSISGTSSSGNATTCSEEVTIGGLIRGGEANYQLIGNVYEVIVFNSALTTSQRQQVEGYLARKWGISISATLPSPHPFKSFPPASLPFSPRNISELQLWLDAADQGSMTLSGSNVTQWNDKSGNEKHATAGGTTPTYSSATRSIVFGGAGYFTNSSLSLPLSTRSVFIVCKQTSRAADFEGIMLLSSPSDGSIDYDSSTTIPYFASGSNVVVGDTAFSIYNRGTYVQNYRPYVLTPLGIYTDVFGSSSGTLYVNGTSNSTVADSSGLGTANGYILGARKFSGTTLSTFLNGTINEILVYNTALTTSQRQQVEGYLAQKWGLTTSLPATHPYVKLPA